MIEVLNLSYKIGKSQILDQINFKVSPSEVLVVIGPNGAGKSTLLKLISKQIKVQEGQVKINEQEIGTLELQELAKVRAVLSQSNYLNINLTVYDVALMGRYPHFKTNPSPRDVEITLQVLEEMGMLAIKDRMIHSLSGGEQQRVQLARVLAQIYDCEQGILLMDEPINGLDLQYQQVILEKARYLANKGFAVLCILHDINLAAQFADKIMILKHGKMMGYGPPEEVLTENLLYNTYQTRVKRFHEPSIGYPIIVPVT